MFLTHEIRDTLITQVEKMADILAAFPQSHLYAVFTRIP